MKLRHFSTVEIPKLDNLTFHQRMSPKPKGLWVSDEKDGDGWKRWCRSEDFQLAGLSYEHKVTLTGREKILYLRTAEAIDEFTAAYKANSDTNRLMIEINEKLNNTMPHLRQYDRGADIMDIDWERVAAEYQGIIITPYQWARRMTNHTMWYYGWDCASGCIWDMSAIGRIELKRYRKHYAGVVELTFEERMAEMRKAYNGLAEATKDSDHPLPSLTDIDGMVSRGSLKRYADV